MPKYLYGHYDSRGGAQLIEAPDRETADRAYYLQFWPDDANEPNTETYRKELVEEDFIAEVTLESYREIKHGEEIEYTDPVEGQDSEKARAFEDGLAWAAEDIIETTANPWKELLWWNEERKILRICPPGVNPTFPERPADFGTQNIYGAHEPTEPGWKRSNFGEDACGVIYGEAKQILENEV